MKPKLIVKNIGPIKDVTIDINQINLIIGKQGSGKSTLAKLISFCVWAEKKIVTEYGFELDKHVGTLIARLISYHKLEGYFDSRSMLKYDTDYVSIECSFLPNKCVMELKSRDTFTNKQITYIPADRNIVSAIPNWFEVKLGDNNIRGFMTDWENARKTTSKNRVLPIVDTAVQYYYNPNENKDVLVIGTGKEIEMTNAASGFQSLIPLLSIVNYYSKWIYQNKREKSVEDIQRETNLKLQYLQTYIRDKYPKVNFAELLAVITADGENEKKISMTEVFDEATVNMVRCFTPGSSFFIIEEPEQNLFPDTQRHLVYHLIKDIAFGDPKHSIVLTTHSPYILFALNNCMMGGLVAADIPMERYAEFESHGSWINPETVSIWQIKNGELVSLQDSDGILEDNYLNQASNNNSNEYLRLLNYYEG